jgi:orotidine-5'-phosphate decarboxylase
MARQVEREAKDRLIVALDVPARREALALVDALDGLVSFFKIGYQLFTAAGPELVRELSEKREKRVFLDLKMDDVPETIRSAVRSMSELGVHFATIQGGAATARAAHEGRGDRPRPLILAVPLLSSLSEQDLREILHLDPTTERLPEALLDSYVRKRARACLDAGADGLIAAGASIGVLRSLHPDAWIVSPGIRPAGSGSDDHKRSVTPGDAIALGADYLVVGRPVRQAAHPEQVVAAIIAEIAAAASYC